MTSQQLRAGASYALFALIEGAVWSSRWRRRAELWARRSWSGGPLRHPSILLAVVTATTLTACGGTSGQAGESADDRSCEEVHAELEEANRVRAKTFGDGPDGQEAMETIRRAIEQRPDCFDEDSKPVSAIDFLPAGTADAARMVADACGGVTTGMADLEDPHAEPADSLEGALTDARDRLPPDLVPDGEPTRSTEDADGVGFDLYDDGEFRGWVMVEEVDDGWVVRFAMSCA